MAPGDGSGLSGSTENVEESRKYDNPTNRPLSEAMNMTIPLTDPSGTTSHAPIALADGPVLTICFHEQEADPTSRLLAVR